jgi:CRISPR-associated protein Cmr5
MNKKQTLDQQRAAHAWGLVKQVEDMGDSNKKKEFGTQAKKLPTRILAAGLGQALAFLMAKNYSPDLQSALSEWLAERRKPKTEEKRLLVRIIDGDAEFQRYATAECLAYLQWLVRFADARGLTKGTEG